ncbi:Hypothetical protein A7982_12121 [Minicystis rosea]|nr:Hypothetical protein A7982_12121 [Minicystis rosea]
MDAPLRSASRSAMVDRGYGMLQLENQTPFDVSILVLPDVEGVDTLYVAVRAAFVFDHAVAIAEPQTRLLTADEHWGDPATTSLKYIAEAHLQKPATDIALLGHAWPIGGRPASVVDATLAVGPVRKTIRVFGDRVWRGASDPEPSAPAPFDRMPLVYERAFGGVLRIDPTRGPTLDRRNPVGIGPATQRLPNVEDPAQLITRITDVPTPAGFGFIAPSWEPRSLAAGTYDARWRETRAPFLPTDFHPRFFNAAHPDLVSRGHLQGGEDVTALNVAPYGPVRFRLPVCRFDVAVHIARTIEKPPLLLETVLIEPDDQRLGLTFRGAVRCDKRALRISRVRVALETLHLDGRAA